MNMLERNSGLVQVLTIASFLLHTCSNACRRLESRLRDVCACVRCALTMAAVRIKRRTSCFYENPAEQY